MMVVLLLVCVGLCASQVFPPQLDDYASCDGLVARAQGWERPASLPGSSAYGLYAGSVVRQAIANKTEGVSPSRPTTVVVCYDGKAVMKEYHGVILDGIDAENVDLLLIGVGGRVVMNSMSADLDTNPFNARLRSVTFADMVVRGHFDVDAAWNVSAVRVDYVGTEAREAHEDWRWRVGGHVTVRDSSIKSGDLWISSFNDSWPALSVTFQNVEAWSAHLKLAPGVLSGTNWSLNGTDDNGFFNRVELVNVTLREVEWCVEAVDVELRNVTEKRVFRRVAALTVNIDESLLSGEAPRLVGPTCYSKHDDTRDHFGYPLQPERYFAVGRTLNASKTTLRWGTKEEGSSVNCADRVPLILNLWVKALAITTWTCPGCPTPNPSHTVENLPWPSLSVHDIDVYRAPCAGDKLPFECPPAIANVTTASSLECQPKCWQYKHNSAECEQLFPPRMEMLSGDDDDGASSWKAVAIVSIVAFVVTVVALAAFCFAVRRGRAPGFVKAQL